MPHASLSLLRRKSNPRRPAPGQLSFDFERSVDEKFCEFCGIQLRRDKRTGRRSPKEWGDLRFCSISCSQRLRQIKESKRPDAATLRRLYMEERLSAEKIGAIYGVTPFPVYRWLSDAGIRTRDAGGMPPDRDIDVPDRDTLHRLIYEEFQTYKQIGKRYGVSPAAVGYWMKKHEISQPTSWHSLRRGRRPAMPDEATVRGMYESGKTIRQIGLIYGVTDYFVHTWLDFYGILKRPGGYNFQNGRRYLCNDGNLVRSSYEKRVADWLYSQGIEYEYEPRLPFGFNCRGDFLVNGWYVEIWGMSGDQKYEERKRRKLSGYLSHGLPLIELNIWHFPVMKPSTFEKRLGKCLVPPS